MTFTNTTTEVPVEVTEEERAAFEERAAKMHLDIGNFFKKAAEEYEPVDDEALDLAIDQMNLSTKHAIAAVDGALSFCAESNKRIEQMEAAHRERKSK